MKSFSLPLFVLWSIAVHAATLTVNNSNPSPGQYTSISAAITAALAGDTLLITGTAFNYGDFTIGKNNLVLLGAGFNPQKSPAFGTVVNSIFLSATVNGCKIRGINFQDLNTANAGGGQDNISVEYCYIRSGIQWWTNCNDWSIKNCVFACDNCCAINSSNTSGRSNLIITNNLFNQSSGICNFTNGNSGILVSNNIFLKGTGPDDGASNNTDNVLFSNNIFFQIRPAFVNATSNCTYNNNLTFSTGNNTLPPNDCPSCTGTGNLVNQDPLFTTYTAGQNWNAAFNMLLQATSPGHLAGTDGTDLGVYGSGNIFSETGEPSIPVVRTIVISNPNTTVGSSLNITVTASNPINTQ